MRKALLAFAILLACASGASAQSVDVTGTWDCVQASVGGGFGSGTGQVRYQLLLSGGGSFQAQGIGGGGVPFQAQGNWRYEPGVYARTAVSGMGQQVDVTGFVRGFGFKADITSERTMTYEFVSVNNMAVTLVCQR